MKGRLTLETVHRRLGLWASTQGDLDFLRDKRVAASWFRRSPVYSRSERADKCQKIHADGVGAAIDVPGAGSPRAE
jgi:hypothetical protein